MHKEHNIIVPCELISKIIYSIPTIKIYQDLFALK